MKLDPRYRAPLLITLILVGAHWSAGVLRGYQAITVAIGVSLLADVLIGRRLLGERRHLSSAYISGISIGILVRSPLLWPYAIGSLLSILSKYVLRLDGRHLWNPSNFGICVLLFLAPSAVAPLSVHWGNDLWPMLVIWAIGIIAVWRAGRAHITINYLLAFLVFALIRSRITGHTYLAEIAPLTGPMYQLFALFMVTDPKTTVRSRNGGIAVVWIVAAVEMLLRLGQVVYAPFYALFLVGPAAIAIETVRARRNATARACAQRVAALLAALVLVGCARAESGSRPSFDLVFPPIEGDLMTISSPSVIDLRGDGSLDIVFGVGVERVRPDGQRMVFTAEPEVPGYVVAVSGATNDVLWKAPHPGDAFTTPRFADLNRDGVADVIMGGREGALSALSGVDGSVLWRVAPAAVAATPFPYNFFTPALIRDANGDGVQDIVVVHGGDDTRMPADPRDVSYLAVISGADGKIVAVHETPDRKESYSSIVVYERPDGAEWFVFGTGGETHGGAAYRAPVASLLDGTFANRAERLVAPGESQGVIAPATLVDLTGDGELDIVISTFDGRLVAVAGASGEPLWERRDEGEQTYHPAAVVRLADDGRLGLFISRGIGAFPRYVGSVHRLLDAADGRVLYEYRDPFYPAGAPLAVDLDGDGFDEPFFFSVRFPSGQGSRIYVLHVATGELIAHDLTTNFWSTPVISDARGTGTLELIGLGWTVGENRAVAAWRDLNWRLLRMDLEDRKSVV